jgi:hypothetical protein
MQQRETWNVKPSSLSMCACSTSVLTRLLRLCAAYLDARECQHELKGAYSSFVVQSAEQLPHLGARLPSRAGPESFSTQLRAAM